MSKLKIGVFVGSFNPVHIGHTNIMDYLISHKVVDKVLVIPTLAYWDKQNILDLDSRINMLKYIASNNIIIDTTHNDIPYTYQILSQLENESKNEYYLVIGADNAQNIHLWKNHQELLKRKIIVLGRNNLKISNPGNFIYIEKEFSPISSTVIRQNPKKYREYLNPQVYNYIINNNLYKENL